MKINSSISSSEKIAVKRLFFRLLIFLPIPVMILMVNYFIDPARLYWGARNYDCIASAIASGMNVGRLSNLDERLVQNKIIMQLKSPPRTLIIGSSRSMMIGDNIFQGKTLNNSVSGANLPDYLALFYAYYLKNYRPEIFVMGLDPWVLIHDGDVRWQSVGDDYYKMLKIINIKSSNQVALVSKKALNLASLSYFQMGTDNFTIQLKKTWEEKSCFATHSVDAKDEQMLLKDGRRVYDDKFRLRSVADVEKSAIEYGNTNPVYSIESFAKVDKEKQTILEAFIKYILSSGIKVVIYLPPYHPSTYSKLLSRDDTQIVLEAEKYYKELGVRFNIPVVGSSNPNNYKLNGAGFFDGMHAKESAAESIFKAEEKKLAKHGIGLK